MALGRKRRHRCITHLLYLFPPATPFPPLAPPRTPSHPAPTDLSLCSNCILLQQILYRETCLTNHFSSFIFWETKAGFPHGAFYCRHTHDQHRNMLSMGWRFSLFLRSFALGRGRERNQLLCNDWFSIFKFFYNLFFFFFFFFWVQGGGWGEDRELPKSKL